jgi:hypothetical protein
MFKKLYLKFFHKKHEFVYKFVESNQANITCGRNGKAIYSFDRVKSEIATCKICGHVKKT